MKKMIGFIAILTLLLTYSFFSYSAENSEEAGNDLPVIGILQLTSHPALDLIKEGIVDALNEAGYVDGKTMILDFQNAQGDQSNLNSMSTRFVSRDADVMVGIATAAAQALANASSEIPIVLGAITDPQASNLVESNEHPGGNITGVSDATPIEEQMALIQEILPEAKKIGVIYSSSEDNSIVQGKEGAEVAGKLGYETITMTVSSTNDINQVGAALASQVDAIWVPTDNTIASAMNTLIQATDAEGIPVFPAVETMIEQGGLATVGLNQYELGKLTGEMTAAILDGEMVPAETPIQYLEQGDIFINPEKAEQLGISIPKQVTEQAKIVK